MIALNPRTVTRDEIIKIVHKLDALEEEKKRQVADFDAQIATLQKHLDSACVLTRPKPTSKITLPKKLPLKKRRVVEHVLTNPQADYDSLITAVYGANTKKTSDAAHSLVWGMKKKGLIAGEPGAWRVTTPST